MADKDPPSPKHEGESLLFGRLWVKPAMTVGSKPAMTQSGAKSKQQKTYNK